ncbi:RHS repeat-associated core domain-containing protein [Kribbella catacumbae]|uniref:RHS repeat-associated core domain-containing protein n=1 Tax=Kribbella catacumbae TaxID=460086 RepID=UPI00039FD1B3|nr:RHS repeat-associated core domain-containing protein [Kribbella catacumbae]
MSRAVAVRTAVLVTVSACALLAGGLPVIGAQTSSAATISKIPPSPKARDAKVRALEVATAKRSVEQRAREMVRGPQPKPATWPTAADQAVALGPVAGSAIQLAAPKARAKGAPATPAKMRVRVLDQKAATAADVSGFLLGLTRADQGLGEAPAQLTVDYSGFAEASGGDWASRLKLVSLPACALTTPRVEGCLTPAEVGSVNNIEKQTLTAPVSVGNIERVMAVTADSGGSGGDYAATSLSPAASWSAGRSSGDFTWNYPLRVPPAPAGPTPKLSIDYSAQSVDGKTVASNSQSSSVGEGFGLTESYVERKYGSCKDDGQVGKYDLCWKYDNATVVLNGQANELVKGTNGWRLKNDDGSKVEKVVNPTANGDDDNEAWKVTTLDGTQYYFGRQLLAGQNSVWTVPVAGDDANEPCNKATFATSFCDNQAWRWNLDYVVDPHGNAMSLWYAKEINYYAKNGATTATKVYDRGGYLTKILYGQRSDAMTATAPMQVLFETQERCLTNCTSLTSATKANWPDVPFDQICASGATCTKVSPTFFSRRRLTQVTTQVLKGAAYQSVDGWALSQDFPSPGDPMSGRALWLQSITHTGKAVAPTAAAPLVVSFGKKPLPNRVDTDSDGIGPMMKIRVGNIWTETGAQITVNYAEPECVAGVKMPASADTNTMRCYPVKWQPPLSAEREDWFHRHVVTEVRVNDITGGADAVVTNYAYGGGAAWHYQENPLIPAKDRNWSDWRGFRTVTTSSGDPFQPGPRSRVVTSYFRGMHGDKLKAGGTKSVSVADTLGGARADVPALNGLVREAIAYASDSSNTEISGSLTDYWVHETAAQTIETGLVRRANITKPSAVAGRITRDGGRSDLVHVALTEYDPATGLVVQTEDQGDSAKVDETCTLTSYAKNAATGLVVPSRIVTSEGRCDAASAFPPENRAMTDTRTFYDGGSLGAAPTKGEITTTQRLDGYRTGQPTYQTVGTSTYDVLGRVTSTTDAIGRVSTVAYTPAGAGALTQTTSRTPAVVTADGVNKSLETKTTFLPEWGSASQVTDPNGKLTSLDYDVLGRLTSVWLPNQLKSAGKLPNTKYAYSLSSTAPSYVRTDSLNILANGYLSGYAIYDSLLRPRQSQEVAANGGRLISETKYNSRGLAIVNNKDLWNNAAPAGTMLSVLDAEVPNETQTTYDGAGRVTMSTFAVSRQTKWSTRTLYSGDAITTLPPNGAAATTEIKDAVGHVVERREYDSSVQTPGFIKSSYTYDVAGKLTQLTSAGATWTYGHDILGRQTTVNDPDSGTTTYEFDAVDRVTSVTNANQKTQITTYDNLNRKVAVHEGSKTDANLRSDWIYDAPGNLGQLYQSARYPAGKSGPAYKSKVTTRNVLYKPTATSVVIPAAEGRELDGIYETMTGYAPDASTIDFTDLPGGGTLGSEILNYTYTQLGQPVSMKSGDGVYVKDLKYTELGDPERYELGSNEDMYVVNTFEMGTRRLKQTLAGDVNIVANHNYEYDPAGNLLKDNNLVGGDTQCYDYDGHRRLTEAWTPADADCGAARSTAALGGPAEYWQSWTYTANGLRKTQTDHTALGDTLQTYNYDTTQPHTVKSITTTGAAPKPTATYAYDVGGNTTARPGPTGTPAQTLAWNADSKLEKLSTTAGDTSYVYDAGGGLLLRKSPGKTTLYLGSLELTLDTATRAVTSKREYSLGGQAVAVKSTVTDRKWLIPDHHDTTQVSVDSTTLATVTRYSTPFGESRGVDPANWPDNHGFLGKPLDKTTGLTHVGAREYDPAIGRFISVDPLMSTGDPQQMLGYTYGNNNPTSMSDPTGLMNQGDGGAPTPAPTKPVVEKPTGGSDKGTNQANPGGDDGGNDHGGGGSDNNNDGGGGVAGWFKKAQKRLDDSSRNDAQGQIGHGIATGMLNTAKGSIDLVLVSRECTMSFTGAICSATIQNFVAITRTPQTLGQAMVAGTTDPIIQNLKAGNWGQAIGQGAWTGAEILLGTKGAGAMASAAARTAETTAANAAARTAAASSSVETAAVVVPPYARSQYIRMSPSARAGALAKAPTCPYCGTKPSTAGDHIVSLKQDWDTGGWADDRVTRSTRANSPDNLIGACTPCNSSKKSHELGPGAGQWWPPGWPAGVWWPYGGP